MRSAKRHFIGINLTDEDLAILKAYRGTNGISHTIRKLIREKAVTVKKLHENDIKTA